MMYEGLVYNILLVDNNFLLGNSYVVYINMFVIWDLIDCVGKYDKAS